MSQSNFCRITVLDYVFCYFVFILCLSGVVTKEWFSSGFFFSFHFARRLQHCFGFCFAARFNALVWKSMGTFKHDEIHHRTLRGLQMWIKDFLFFLRRKVNFWRRLSSILHFQQCLLEDELDASKIMNSLFVWFAIAEYLTSSSI